MSKRILAVRHMPNERQDRVFQYFKALDYEIETVNVAKGHLLPSDFDGYELAVVYGGSQMASQAEEIDYLRGELAWIRKWVEADKRFLGICLGGQMLARAFGAPVAPHPDGLSEIGFVSAQSSGADASFMPDELTVYHWHKEGFEVPHDGELLATGPIYPNQAFRLGQRAYGLQFHPEVDHTIMHSWLEEAGHMLAEPGAQSREEQIVLADLHFDALGLWLKDFLDKFRHC